METIKTKQCYTGYFTFFISGICAISSGVVVSQLQERFGFSYGTTGTLLSMMSIGNLLASFIIGILPGKIGAKRAVLLLTSGYVIGYLSMTMFGLPALFMVAFFIVGIGKGGTMNTCTILVGNNAKDRTKGMNIMHGCYAFGALMCPFVVAAASGISFRMPTAILAVCGLILWIAFFLVPMDDPQAKAAGKTDWSFLHSKKFWILTGLLFCQNAAETSVTGWLVTYFKGSGILSGVLSTYTVTVMWSATMIARMLIAFVLPIRQAESAMIKMGIGCTLFYLCLMLADNQLMAILLLFAFAASMAGMNPTAVACAGRMTSMTSMAIMLPSASIGAILMPWIIGIVAEHAGIGAGMLCNIVPCGGMLLFSIAAKKLANVYTSPNSVS